MDVVIKEKKLFRVEVEGTIANPAKKVRNWCAANGYIFGSATALPDPKPGVKAYDVEVFYNIRDFRRMGIEAENQVKEDKADIKDITL